MNMIKFYLYRMVYKTYPFIWLYALTLILLVFLFIANQHASLRSQKIIFNQLSSELTQQQIHIEKSAHHQEVLQRLNQEWDNLHAHWLAIEQIEIALNAIEQMARENNITLRQMTVDKNITLSLHCDYIDFLNFIKSLTGTPYFLLTALQLKKETDKILAIVHLNILLSSENV